MSRSNSSLVARVDVARTLSNRENSNVQTENETEKNPAEEIAETFDQGVQTGNRGQGRNCVHAGNSVQGGSFDGVRGWFGSNIEIGGDEEDNSTGILAEETFRRRCSDSWHSGYEGDSGSSETSEEGVVVTRATSTTTVPCRGGFRQQKQQWQQQEESSVRILAARQRRGFLYNVFKQRMVLEPKFADYGSIQSIGEMVVGHQQQPHQQSTDSSGSLVPAGGTVNALTGTDQEICVVKMTQGDLYQRQPLLSAPAKGDKWGHGSHPTPAKEYYVEDDEENILENSHDESTGITKINMPTPVREEPRFPQERWKTLISLVIFFFSSILVLISLATVHERVPDRKTYGPLPDIFYEILGAHDWGLTVSEYLIIFSFISTFVVIFLHKHRFILMRRLCLIMSLLYMYRALTMFVTVLPISSTTYYCSPKNNNTSTLEMTKRVLQMLSGMGLSINGKQTYCGDFIYSGHTLILVLSYLFIAEYTPKKLYFVHWLYWISAAVGIFMLELSRSHYTIDVILAYYVTTRLFWIYHTLANNQHLKQHSERNLLGRSWWFNFFMYFEGNVGGQVPRQWPDWPFPWPRRFQTKSRDS